MIATPVIDNEWVMGVTDNRKAPFQHVEECNTHDLASRHRNEEDVQDDNNSPIRTMLTKIDTKPSIRLFPQGVHRVCETKNQFSNDSFPPSTTWRRNAEIQAIILAHHEY